HAAVDGRPGGLQHALQRGTRLGRLHPVRAHPWAALGQAMVDPAPATRGDGHRCPLHPLTWVGTVVLRAPLAILAVAPPERARRTDALVGQRPRSALRPRGAIPVVHVGDPPRAVAWVPRLNQRTALRRLDRRTPQGPPMPRPRRPLAGIRAIGA